MARKGKQVSRKRKAQMPEEEEKQNELILEEVLSISGKNTEKADGLPARVKRSANKSNEVTATPPKKLNDLKTSVSPPSPLPSKQKKSTDKADAVVEIKALSSEKGDPVPNLPDGWRRQIVVRKSGKSAGQIDIYFYSPDGIKLRSRPDVSSYLKKHKSNLKIEEFDFSRVAKTTEAVIKKKAAAENSTIPKKKSKIEEDKSKVGEDSKDSSKNMSTKVSKSPEKVSAEVPPVLDTEEKNVADEKKNKEFPEEKIKEINGKQKEKKNPRDNSISRKGKTQLSEEEQNEKDVSSKKLENAGLSTSVRLKRSANKLNEKASNEPKKLNTEEKKTDECVEANTVNKVKTTERGDPVPNLPDGWKREVVVRKSGVRAGHIDIYFYSPDGIKLRSRPDVASYLKKHKIDLKVEEFDFSRTAKTIKPVVNKKDAAENMPKKKGKTVEEEKSKEMGSKDSSKNISSKESKSEKLSAEVPQEKNDAGKSSKILRKILESKSKKINI